MPRRAGPPGARAAHLALERLDLLRKLLDSRVVPPERQRDVLRAHSPLSRVHRRVQAGPEQAEAGADWAPARLLAFRPSMSPWYADWKCLNVLSTMSSLSAVKRPSESWPGAAPLGAASWLGAAPFGAASWLALPARRGTRKPRARPDQRHAVCHARLWRRPERTCRPGRGAHTPDALGARQGVRPLRAHTRGRCQHARYGCQCRQGCFLLRPESLRGGRSPGAAGRAPQPQHAPYSRPPADRV